MRLVLMIYAVLVPFQVLASVFVWRVSRGTPWLRAVKVAVIWLLPLLGMLASVVHTVLQLRWPAGVGHGGDSAGAYAGDSGSSSGSDGGGSDSGCSDGGSGGGGDSGCS